MKIWFPPSSRPNLTQRFRAAHPMFQCSVSSTPGDVKSLMARHDHFVILGMGGSILPLKSFVSAFRLEDRIHLFDSLDPQEWARLVKLPNALFCLVSKSGETLEIKAMLAELEEANLLERLLIVTDPEKGFLRGFQQARQIPSLEIPSNIGGRFTNFTPLHRALLERFEIPVEAMLESAKHTVAALKSNPGRLQSLYDQIFGQNFGVKKTQLILWAYDLRLRGFCEWAQQAIAESLGKISAQGERVGVTPLVLMGPQDQHSVLQHLVEGPQNSAFWFLGIDFSKQKAQSPRALTAVEEAFQTWGFSEVKRTLYVSTIRTFVERQAAQETDQPLAVMEWDETARSFGEMTALVQAFVEYAGDRLEIDAFNQPGVERGKQIARAILAEGQRENLSWPFT